MITIVLGTRPEIIKMSPIIRACEKLQLDYSVVHTGQHYSYEMDGVFFRDLELPEPGYKLEVGSGTHAKQTGRIMIGLEPILEKINPSVVLVQGDTNTVLAGAITAAKLHIKVGHVEAGLRSFDRSMPEEVNRIVADHVSDYLFAPTEVSRQNLLREGISDDSIAVTGNTVVDAVDANLALSKNSDIVDRLGLSAGYFLVTLHRAENVDKPDRLREIVTALQGVGRDYSKIIVFPMHPRTRKMVQSFKIETSSLKIVDPVSYLDFLKLESEAAMILTDSGGVQEEACVLHVPCVTIRENTERPETCDVGANVVAGVSSRKIAEAVARMSGGPRNWANPYGTGDAGEKILQYLKERIE